MRCDDIDIYVGMMSKECTHEMIIFYIYYVFTFNVTHIPKYLEQIMSPRMNKNTIRFS